MTVNFAKIPCDTLGKEKDSVLIPIHKGGPQDGLGRKGMQIVIGGGVNITKRAKEERNIGQTCLIPPSHGGCEVYFIPVPLGSLPSEASLRVRLGSMPTDFFFAHILEAGFWYFIWIQTMFTGVWF